MSEPRSYHGQPVIKEPIWTPEIPWYFFAGGLGGASAGLAWLAELRGNAVLARRKVVPIKVELARAGEEPRHAEHAYTWRLSQDDHQRIDETRSYLTSYREVPNEQFKRDTKPHEKAK